VLVLYTLEKMPITVRDLLELPGLGLTVVAGHEGLDRAIRWAHISELQDPTPWLSGGELLLTTGMDLKGSPALQRAYVRRLVKAKLAGLGFGIGFSFDEVPAAIRRAADRDGFPVIEVSYPVPFIAITEAISSRLGQDRLRDAQMSVEVHERLTSLVAEGAGPADVLDEMIALAGGWAMLFDLRGGLLASAHSHALDPPAPDEVWRSLPRGLTDRRGPTSTTTETSPRGSRVGLAVVAGKRHEAVLVFGKDTKLDQRNRIVVHHAVTVLGLLLASRRAVIEAERRIVGDILSEAFAGRLSGSDLERRLELVGFPPGASLTALAVEGPVSSDEQGLDDLAWAADAALGRRTSAARTAVIAGRVAALVAHRDPEALAEAVRADLLPTAQGLGLVEGGVRVGVGNSVDARSIRQSYLSAVFALRAASRAKPVASQRDLGSYGFLLGAQPRPVLEGFVSSVLGPLIDRDQFKSSELVSSVRAFIEAGGRWEQGAEVLGVHRHTLRYRVRQAEELLGRDLSSAEDRLEVWLALKAGEILQE
jgi:purine catabolism regulator